MHTSLIGLFDVMDFVLSFYFESESLSG